MNTKFIQVISSLLLLLIISSCTHDKNAIIIDPPYDNSSYFKVNIGDRIFFAKNKSSLNINSKNTLDEQIKWLKENKINKISLQGLANDGTKTMNIAIAQKRAKNVADYFLAKGFPPKNITILPFDGIKQQLDCDNNDCQNKNRTVITIITSN
jgi:peptidoglycan-associated lipoprotein